MDHNFKGHSNEKSISRIETMKEDDINHFDKTIFKGQLWGTPNLISELGYRNALNYCMSNNIKIRDLTIGVNVKYFKR